MSRCRPALRALRLRSNPLTSLEPAEFRKLWRRARFASGWGDSTPRTRSTTSATWWLTRSASCGKPNKISPLWLQPLAKRVKLLNSLENVVDQTSQVASPESPTAAKPKGFVLADSAVDRLRQLMEHQKTPEGGLRIL